MWLVKNSEGDTKVTEVWITLCWTHPWVTIREEDLQMYGGRGSKQVR